ncbi:MAG: hypothetical protein E7287_05975 [Lachnospiraceae bacterium]|nr:hypothetical protein [Lachnospiraceae bacterium]
MKNKKHSFGINIGSASILLIFVLLCLISFATLSIVSANADSKLTNKVLERTTAYYDACNKAEASLAEIDKTLIRVYLESDNADAYFASVGHSKSFNITVSEMQTLVVQIEILYPENDEDTFYRIKKWQVVTEEE